MKVVTNCLHFSCEKLDQNQNVRLLSVPTGLCRWRFAFAQSKASWGRTMSCLVQKNVSL